MFTLSISVDRISAVAISDSDSRYLALGTLAAQTLGHSSNRGMGQAAPNQATAARAYRSQCLLPPKKRFLNIHFPLQKSFLKTIFRQNFVDKTDSVQPLHKPRIFFKRKNSGSENNVFPVQFEAEKLYQNSKMPLENFFSRGSKHCLRLPLATLAILGIPRPHTPKLAFSQAAMPQRNPSSLPQAGI